MYLPSDILSQWRQVIDDQKFKYKFVEIYLPTCKQPPKTIHFNFSNFQTSDPPAAIPHKTKLSSAIR